MHLFTILKVIYAYDKTLFAFCPTHFYLLQTNLHKVTSIDLLTDHFVVHLLNVKNNSIGWRLFAIDTLQLGGSVWCFDGYLTKFLKWSNGLRKYL